MDHNMGNKNENQNLYWKRIGNVKPTGFKI
jgi:hypothetical protein